MALSPPTINLGLQVWSQGADTYNHAELAGNFNKIDDHDHTPGKGKRIPQAGLANNSVGTAQLQPDSVTPDKIPNDSITKDELGPDSVGSSELRDNAVDTAAVRDNAITVPKLDPSARIPLGIVLPWWRKDSSVAVPTGWVLAQGQLWTEVPNDLGATDGRVPDMRNRFVLGAAENGSGTDPSTPPTPGATGGSGTISLGHTHTIPAHAHSVPNHAHSIAVQASHTHRFWSHNYDTNGVANSYLTNANQRETGVPSSAGSRQSLYIPNLNINNIESTNVDVPMGPDEYAGGVQHNHGGATGGSGAIGTSSTPLLTDPASGGGTDIRPNFIGLLYIMKVKI